MIKPPETINELHALQRKVFPQGSVERDNEGQLIIYTGRIQHEHSLDLNIFVPRDSSSVSRAAN